MTSDQETLQARVEELQRQLSRARTEIDAFKRIQVATPYIVYVFSLDDRRTLFRSRHLAIELGYSAEEAEDMGDRLVEQLAHPDDLARLPKLIERWDRVQDGEILETEHRLRHASGEYRWLLARDTVFERDGAGRVTKILGSSIDITDRKRLETKLLTSQKLEAVGSLASGIAHDFNNILMMVLGNVELTRTASSRDESPSEYLEQIESAVVQASGLTRQLLSFARNQVAKGQVFGPNQAINDTLRLLRRVIGKDIKLAVELGEPMRSIEMDPSQFTQVLINLAVNSRDAMPDGGMLTFKTCVVENDAADWVKIAVIDTGVGMDSETLKQAFEPFFTTKADGQGTGLGLSTVSSIIGRAGGRVRVDSSPEQGTALEILLPARTAVDQRQPQPDSVPSRERRKQRILVVDDEPAVRGILERLLLRQGYAVVSLPSAERALELLDADMDFDALITDLMLPGVGGLEFAQRVRRLRPDMRVLFTSGYAQQLALGQDELPDAAFLAKPFTQTEFAAQVAGLFHVKQQRAAHA